MSARLLRIHGRVQGVGYRESMRREAERLGVCGWVRNRRDGSVEALVSGPDEALQRIIAWAGQGPRGALVLRVECRETDAEAHGAFTIATTE